MRPNVEHYQYLASSYRLFFRDFEENMRMEGAWLSALLHRLGACTVLDACCGTGRQAIPLALAGFAVVAADPCEAMLTEGRRLADEHGATLPWVRADFESLPQHVHGRFDAVIAMGNGLSHCPGREDVIRALTAIHSLCTPDGVGIIGIKDFDQIRHAAERQHTYGHEDHNGTSSDLTQTWELRESQLICSTTLLRNDTASGRVRSVIRAQTREYMLGREEMRAVSLESGFRAVEPVEHPGEAVYLLRA